MVDRKEAFSAMRLGVISDDQLKQVVSDLQTVVDVLHAMGERGVVLMGFYRELDTARFMLDARKRG